MEELPGGSSFSELLNVYLTRKDNSGDRKFQPIEKYDTKLPFANERLNRASEKFTEMGQYVLRQCICGA